MQFVILARDSEVAGTLEKRMAHRAEHLKTIHRMKADGSIIDAGALLSAEGTMVGSLILCDFADRPALDAYIASETYQRYGIWADIEVLPFRRTLWSG